MSTIFKIIYVAGVVFIAVCVIIAILLKILPLEFSSVNYGEAFESAMFWGIPLAILLTISRIGFKKNLDRLKIKMIIRKAVIIAVCYLLCFFFYAFSTFGLGMCTWSTGETIFENKSHKSMRIVKRYFGCGATDSSPATVGVFKLTEVTPVFIYVKKIDTNNLDRNEWMRIQNR